jgi:hypothetical protein
VGLRGLRAVRSSAGKRAGPGRSGGFLVRSGEAMPAPNTAPPAETVRTARTAPLREGAPMPGGYGGQVPPSVVNSTKMTVVTARMPWAMTTGTGKFRSGGTLRFLVSGEPG